MYYSSGNYEAFARPRKPEGIENKTAFFVGSGLASLAGAAFLIRDGRVLAAAVRDIDVRKTGFERFVTRAADRHAILYGLTAVALSALLGWGAGRIARRT